MAVAGMAAYSEVSRAHEIANDMRRINKQLKEAQQWAVVYNNRERLFGMPVTNVSSSEVKTRPISWAQNWVKFGKIRVFFQIRFW